MVDAAPLSVKRLLEQLKARVEPAFAAVCVVGEVSNFRSSGKHWYFTLKEDGAALSCAVWAGQQRFVKTTPRNGERVIVKGSLNLYVAGGSLTLAVTHIEPAGQGDLQAQLRQREAELRAEGLFDRPKRPLPRFPQRLGIIAALGGAALRDVLEVTQRRAPGVHLLIAPAAAQGERAVPENLLALQELQDEFWKCDAILMVRGGGSLEDLWSFNDPGLVRAVASCRLPIVTGVGHEIDTTLVDLAADRRAATPSQAAELTTPDRGQLASELQRRIDALQTRMEWRLRGFETTLNLRLDHGLLRHDPVQTARQRFEKLASRLHLAHPQRRLDQASARLALLRQRLLHAAHLASGEGDRPRLIQARQRLAPALHHLLERLERRRAVLEARLQGLDPTGPLERGFVLALDDAGRPVVKASQPLKGSQLKLRWKDGSRTATLRD
ncbi:MAG: exodeoxyribonuclease VII large subunit [Firmicutes bacterium]|nr:exodeoxyribonuclease VII large subunit [Bacillota bacterium]